MEEIKDPWESSLENKAEEEKARKKFVRNSIINFPSIKNQIYKNINLSNFSNHLTKSSNYTSIHGTHLDDGKYWEISNLSDFIHLRDDIRNIPRQKSFRTIEEFTYLLDFIHTEEIKLFIGKDIQDPDDKDYGATYYRKDNTVVINYDSLFDVDSMCGVLTHELIHYLQQGKPLKIDIEDSIIDKDYLSYYEENIGDSLRYELEARTFQYFPNFIKKYLQNKSQFFVSPERDWTIDWICQNKSLPTYESPSLLSQEKIVKFDFAVGEIREIKPIKNEIQEELDSTNSDQDEENYEYILPHLDPNNFEVDPYGSTNKKKKKEAIFTETIGGLNYRGAPYTLKKNQYEKKNFVDGNNLKNSYYASNSNNSFTFGLPRGIYIYYLICGILFIYVPPFAILLALIGIIIDLYKN